MYELWNVARDSKRNHDTVESAKKSAELNYDNNRRGIQSRKGVAKYVGDPMIWKLSCVGGSDEHWQGFEPHYSMHDGTLRNNVMEEPNWVIPMAD